MKCSPISRAHCFRLPLRARAARPRACARARQQQRAAGAFLRSIQRLTGLRCTRRAAAEAGVVGDLKGCACTGGVWAGASAARPTGVRASDASALLGSARGVRARARRRLRGVAARGGGRGAAAWRQRRRRPRRGAGARRAGRQRRHAAAAARRVHAGRRLGVRAGALPGGRCVPCAMQTRRAAISMHMHACARGFVTPDAQCVPGVLLRLRSRSPHACRD